MYEQKFDTAEVFQNGEAKFSTWARKYKARLNIWYAETHGLPIVDDFGHYIDYLTPLLQSWFPPVSNLIEFAVVIEVSDPKILEHGSLEGVIRVEVDDPLYEGVKSAF
nr:hypothetical protein [uncultured Nitrososphaera sp.]